MDEIEIPSYFLCPISLEIMKDPVMVSTGITYDRESIEKWLFSQKNNSCPATKQVVIDSELTPNITLRRFIQSWCTLHAPDGVERIPTPKAPISKTQLLKLFNDAKSPNMQMKSLQRLRSIASHNEANKRFMETAGTAEFLASLIVKKNVEASSAEVSEDVIELRRTSNEALSILYHLQLSGSGLKSLLESNIELIESLTSIMQSENYDSVNGKVNLVIHSRVYAVMLLKSMFEVADSNQPIDLRPEFFPELVDILNDQISQKASKATLKALISVCPWGRNRIKAVEAGAVPLLIDLLLDSSDKRASELMLMVLDLLCQCAEGRAELLNHSAGLAIVSKKILRVSSAANKSGIKILHSISKFSATSGVLQEMLQIGAVTKLCLVLQVFDRGSKTKEKAREILKLHARAWRNSSCIPTHLLATYPS